MFGILESGVGASPVRLSDGFVFVPVLSGGWSSGCGNDSNWWNDCGGCEVVWVARILSAVFVVRLLGWRQDFFSRLLLLLGLLRVTVEEQIDHDLPWLLAWDLTAETQDFACQQPPHKTDRVSRLGVAWDGDIDVLQRAVSVCESNDRNVDIRSLGDGLVVAQRVSDDQKTRLAESGLSLIGERTRSETSGNRSRSGVVGELQDSALSERTRRDGVDLKDEKFINIFVWDEEINDFWEA